MNDTVQLTVNALRLARPYKTDDPRYSIELSKWGETVAAICYTYRQNIDNFDSKKFYIDTGYAEHFYTGV